MKACNNYTSLITTVASGAAGEGDRLRLEEHTSNCEGCAAEYVRLSSLLAAVRIEQEDPGDAYWQGYYKQIMERIDGIPSIAYSSEMQTTGSAGDVLRQRLVRLADWLVPRQRWALQLAVAALLVVAGVLLGRTFLSPVEIDPQLAENDLSSTQIQQNALEMRAHAYLGKSKTLLLGLVNFDLEEDDPSTLNFEKRRVIAGDLVREASFLQDRLSFAEHQRLRRLVADLEVILIQIANIESAYDVPEIEIVQSGVARKAILFKIDVEEMRRDDAAISTEFSNRRSAPATSSV
ncbi:MAG: hypothetical protein E2O85_01945 [Bacteroidetes bacterium]|nr:MAG: hypothetical protein E2O85_01945 [Bacteroidota bacterium]